MELDSPARLKYIGGSYLLIRPIGRGATGTVWRAVDRSTDTEVAVKILHADVARAPKLVTRFVQERAILLMLRHPHIVRVRDLLTAGDSLGLVMDLVLGGSLRDLLQAGGPLPPSQAARLLGQVAAALTEAHGLGVVHRDLKPDNILLHPGSSGPETRLTDFGIARVLDSPGLTTPGALVGTANYLCPETIDGAPPSPAGDVYALGAVLYELVVGQPPFGDGPIVRVLRRHLEDQPPRPPGISDELWALIESCLAKEPADRPTTPRLVEALARLEDRAAGVPALRGPDRATSRARTCDPEFPAGRLRPVHPSRRPGRPPKNFVNEKNWRWLRRGGLTALLLAAVLGTGTAIDWPRSGLLFTGAEPRHTCGPVTVAAPRGHRYQVGQSWAALDGLLPGGSTKGTEFDW